MLRNFLESPANALKLKFILYAAKEFSKHGLQLPKNSAKMRALVDPRDLSCGHAKRMLRSAVTSK